MVTSAIPKGGRFVVPLKMQSAMRSARKDLWLCSPSTQEMASTTFDLPQPFGPTIHVVPKPLNVTTVRSQNDLKPTISTFRSLSNLSPSPFVSLHPYFDAASHCLVDPSRSFPFRHFERSENFLVSERFLRGEIPLQQSHKHTLGDDVVFLEGRVFRASGRSNPQLDRPHKHVAGSFSEAQPPGAASDGGTV